MEIRLSDKMINNSILQSMLSNQSSLTKLSNEISSDKKVNVASDDPLAALSILQTNTAIDKNSNYTTAVTNAQSELKTTDSSLTNLVDIITKAKSLATQAANGTNSTINLAAISDQITQLIGEVQDIGNTKIGNKYIFGGINTATPPFASATGGGIQYNGTPSTSNYARSVDIGDGVSVTINLAGDSILGQSWTDNSSGSPVDHKYGLLNDLETLNANLKSATPNFTTISSSIDSLSTDLNTVAGAQATIGGIENRLTMTQSTLSSSATTLASIKSNAQDADLTTIISQYQAQTTAYQASLKVGASINNISLLNYM